MLKQPGLSDPSRDTKGQVLMYLPIDFSDQVINVGLLIQFQQST